MADAVDAVIGLWRHERPDLEDKLWPAEVIGRVQRLSRILDRKLKEFNAEHDLESWEFDVLTTLRRSGEAGGLTPGALLKAAMVTSGAITNRIDRMETKGLVERVRDGDDRRSIKIRLTAKGRQVVDEVFVLHLENEARLLPELKPEQWAELVGGLRLLLEHFGDTSLE
ncbi:MarR family transcriptional regulator [Amycolatopsis oliviviridis]|uniref:MarR family transcriptional regulator n=1 Tax=Amycolatopsis oliviviridis TaxID=1471590 RepID=A0ABQ3M9W3_9PSEU|nr:MarR family transcriptional regulator [Amycolatopsis oliviviridis]GHH30445.1 MarR family transcriptional regulator [Amycolatopsis oliviviridis]